MKIVAKRLVFSLGILAVLAAVFAACENPWMKSITAPLYKDKEIPGTPEPVPPVLTLTGTVSISGTPEPGYALTADTSFLDGTGTIGYRWGRGDALAGPFTDIASATAPAYTLQTADNGKYIIVTVTRAGYNGSVGSYPGLGPVGLPLLTGTVTVTGTPEAGQTLTAAASLGGSGTVSYQWRRGDAPAGPFTDIATASTYTLTTADNGKYIVVTVTRADNSGYITSGALGPVGLPLLTGTVSITGTPEVGQTLAADTSSLGGGGTVGYQWRRGDTSAGPFTDIASATASTYILTAADNGKYIVVTVTRAGNSGSVTSGSVGPVTLPVLNSVANIAAWIAADTAHGGTAANPVDLPPVNLSLASDWANLLGALQTAGKYVKLDLSECTMSGMEFDPGAANTGESKIVSLTLPDDATSVKAGVPDATFRYFTALRSVTGESVTTIGENAFGLRTSLRSVSFPVATSIGDSAFSNCTILNEVNIPAATDIGFGAFDYCISLASINLPVVTSIGFGAFYYCSSLASVSFPASLTSIDGNPFQSCIVLTNITVDGGNTIYKHSDDKKMLLSKDGATLLAYPSATGTLPTLPSTITNIGDLAFYGCTGLREVNLPNSLTSIGANAFVGCTSLESVSLPGVTSIGWVAFGDTGTTGLTVTLGNTVPTLAPGMFMIVTAAKTVTVKVPNNAAWSGKTGTFTGGDNTDNWGNGFRGGAWNSGAMTDSSVSDGSIYGINSNITLIVEYE